MRGWMMVMLTAAGALAPGRCWAQVERVPSPFALAPAPPPLTAAEAVADPCEAVRRLYVDDRMARVNSGSAESRPFPAGKPPPEYLAAMRAQYEHDSHLEGDSLDWLVRGMLGVVPSVGVMVRDQVHPTVSWPLSFAFGAPSACRFRPGLMNDGIVRFRPHRVVIEPGLTPGDGRGLLWLRLGYRMMWHPADSHLGLGLGLGTTLRPSSLSERGPSLSPELVLHYGKCCEHGFVTLAARYDRNFMGKSGDEVSMNLGVSFY